MSFHDVNFLAVGVATVFAVLFGVLWYSPVLFARQWMAAHGYSEDKVREMQGGPGRPISCRSFVGS